jgi:hypothetical protein
MGKQLMNLVLPRLARPLYRQLQRYRAGELNDHQFTKGFETLLQKQHAWLAKRGVPEVRAALAIHGAVLILSGPGLKAESEELGVPLEVVENRAIREAATDVARTYGMNERQAAHVIARIVARYGS